MDHYGDTPNRLPLVELESRYEIAESHPYFVERIDESMSVDVTLHSLFGASKRAGDNLLQEYGGYFGMPAACFRGSRLTGAAHAGAELHGDCAAQGVDVVAGSRFSRLNYPFTKIVLNRVCHALAMGRPSRCGRWSRGISVSGPPPSHWSGCSPPRPN